MRFECGAKAAALPPPLSSRPFVACCWYYGYRGLGRRFLCNINFRSFRGGCFTLFVFSVLLSYTRQYMSFSPTTIVTIPITTATGAASTAPIAAHMRFVIFLQLLPADPVALIRCLRSPCDLPGRTADSSLFPPPPLPNTHTHTRAHSLPELAPGAEAPSHAHSAGGCIQQHLRERVAVQTPRHVTVPAVKKRKTENNKPARRHANAATSISTAGCKRILDLARHSLSRTAQHQRRWW